MSAIVFLVTEDWYFVSHRLPLAVALRERGWTVTVATRCTGADARLREAGLEVVPLPWRRRGGSWRAELTAFRTVRRLVRERAPDVLHLVALKPTLFGAAAALGHRSTRVVAAIAGLGFLFTSDSLRARLLRPAFVRALGVLLARVDARVIVQNPEDRVAITRAGVAREEAVTLIRGAGVDLAEFGCAPEPDGLPVVLLAGRLLYSKGVANFVAAARLLAGQARFVLCGEPDDDNPDAVPRPALEAWTREGAVEWWGRRSDMPAVLAASHVVCLPTVYGEGVPKILLEAAAVGRPLVATDWPGCREVVQDGVNGRLVPPRDVPALAAALRELVESPALRRRFGAASRRIAEADFSLEHVVRETLRLYGVADRA